MKESGEDIAAQEEPARIPAFLHIKNTLLAQIQSGHWKEGDAIPSEQALAKEFGVSRMTVNRAVKELTDEQILTRVQGSGTYVAQHKYQATLVEIRSIAEEVRARGHAHRSELHRLERARANEALAAAFGLKSGQPLFHSIIVHFENEIPIQVEDRWVNPEVAPEYMQQDFSVLTPNEYLMAAAPLQGVNYSIEALCPPKDVADMLQISAREACLVLKRRTLSKGQVASVATMWHPGNRYQFAGSF
ncbi:histidine utilization repressor [Noviherbaspirillum galbum]|uniref:Histidine utilization repressor n=1 Tax=Noviherbaspirillum galbum TaxID=2709383 RepID=A0A6B3SJD5_9BURK|nr:histidine utilization repressor [Noviherbaspirillum galbum]NEX60931.1 histidine utilization repressor [Noviherbaspirillum galbum]